MRCSVMAVKSDGGDDGGDYYDREGPACVSNTTTSASLRTLHPASLADLRVTAYSPDILSNGIISEGEEVRNETARAMAVTTAATTTISTSLFAVAALCLNFLSCSRFTPVLLFIQTYQYCKLEPGVLERYKTVCMTTSMSTYV